MNFSAKVKQEILSLGFESPCCQIAALSAFLRTAGAIEVRNGLIGFVAISEISQIKFFSELISRLYGEKMLYSEEKANRAKIELFGSTAEKIMTDTEILHFDGQSAMLEFAIEGYICENDCCKVAFVKGAFLGSGTVTVPKVEKPSATGYHLEFVFSKYATADSFCDLIAGLGFSAKLIERKDYFVVYVKNAEEIKDALALMGASKACFEMADIIIRKEIKNNMNRIVNCEMSNMTKQVDASIKARESIELIRDTVGIESLPQNLKIVAEARLNYAEASLSELSETLQITKSCLSHRLRRINEIALSLQ